MKSSEIEKRNGAGGQNRTVDTRIFSPLLYQLSYPGTGRANLRKQIQKVKL